MPTDSPNRSKSLAREVECDLTPMIDLVFLLIVFFLCVSDLIKQEYVQLTLPQSLAAAEDVPAHTRRVVVNVAWRDDATEVLVRQKIYRRTEDLIELLRAQAAPDPERPLEVRIRADRRAPYARVQQVLAACARAGIARISIAAEPQKEGGI
ncbi:MAG: biopolymer transporter ExbD [Planctomycetes bacterium]|nr:biopolymer transporter ExbD [Planctomycetota bacterium]